MKEQIKLFCRQIGLDCCGIAPSPTGCGSCVVCLFPYYQPLEGPHNLSRYAVMNDYHKIIQTYLQRVSRYILECCGQDYSGFCFCDNTPYHDRDLAVSAGLGFIGKNTCLIHPIYGSYVFIGYIVCDALELEPDQPLDETCAGCGCCISACHGNALDGKTLTAARCASHLSQKKGDLSEEEWCILDRNPLIWGCDTCQEVCPHNHHIPVTPILEFRKDLLPSLFQSDIESYSNKAFIRVYQDRAFSWRGRSVLLRNLVRKEQNDI